VIQRFEGPAEEIVQMRTRENRVEGYSNVRGCGKVQAFRLIELPSKPEVRRRSNSRRQVVKTNRVLADRKNLHRPPTAKPSRRTTQFTCTGRSGSYGSRKTYMRPVSGAAPGSARGRLA